MACFVITNSIMEKENLYKIGYTYNSIQELLREYSTYLLNARVVIYYKTSEINDFYAIQRRFANNIVQTNDDGYSWICIDFVTLKEYIDSYFITSLITKPRYIKTLVGR